MIKPKTDLLDSAVYCKNCGEELPDGSKALKIGRSYFCYNEICYELGLPPGASGEIVEIRYKPLACGSPK